MELDRYQSARELEKSEAEYFRLADDLTREYISKNASIQNRILNGDMEFCLKATKEDLQKIREISRISKKIGRRARRALRAEADAYFSNYQKLFEYQQIIKTAGIIFISFELLASRMGSMIGEKYCGKMPGLQLRTGDHRDLGLEKAKLSPNRGLFC